MFGNYEEKIVKDTVYRGDYLSGTLEFLRRKQQSAQKNREERFTPERYKSEPEVLRGEYIKMLGFPLLNARHTPTLISKTLVAITEGVKIYRMQLQFFDCLPFYGIYFEQENNPQSKPLVFAIHGGQGTPEVISGIDGETYNYNGLVSRIVERGASVFAPQLMLWNQDTYGNGYDRLHFDGKLRQLGGSMTALELYFMRGALDWFIENGLDNEQKIGVAGLSYGGMYALHFAALDERIRACYSCSWVCDGFEHSWADWSYYNAQNMLGTAETLALVCPRALVVAMGDKDTLFEWERTVRACDRAREFYKAQNKEDKLKVCIFSGTHETDKGDEELDFLFSNLQ